MFEPLSLGPDIGTLPNRVLMGSMHTGLEGHSIPSLLMPLLKPEVTHDDLAGMAEYFRLRAEGGVGLMVTGGISPNKAGWVGPFAAKMDSEAEMERHRLVTDAVHSVRIPSGPLSNSDDGASTMTEPARICMQILHTGRYAIHPFAVSASATRSPISPFPAKELSPSGVQSTIADFVRCAALAKRAGYDGVEIMGSEGYLINQFLVRKTNHRTDEYGGPDFANRMRFAVDIVRETRAAVGRDFIIIFRLSMLDLVEDGSSWEEVKLLAQAIEDAGATIINTGIGWHEARVRKFLYYFIHIMVCNVCTCMIHENGTTKKHMAQSCALLHLPTPLRSSDSDHCHQRPPRQLCLGDTKNEGGEDRRRAAVCHQPDQCAACGRRSYCEG